MDLLNALTLELCDTYFCCNQWYTDDKPPGSPPLATDGREEEIGNRIIHGIENDSEIVQVVGGSESNAVSLITLSKHSSVDQGGDSGEEKERLVGWEQKCDIRKAPTQKPTLKQLAEDYIAAQRAEILLRELVAEKRPKSIISMRKQASINTTDGDDDSIDLRVSSQCSEISSMYQLPRDISCDESDKEVNLILRPNSKLETDSKDSGYGAEINGCSKRKLVRNPNNVSRESTSPHPYEVCAGEVCELAPEDKAPELQTYNQDDKSRSRPKKHSVFSSFRRITQGSGKESEEERSSSSKKKRKKKSERGKTTGNLVTPKPKFVLRGKRSPDGVGNSRLPVHNISYESEDM